MKKVFLYILVLLSLDANAQLLVSTPSFITESNTSTTITADATKGNKNLLGNTSDIFVHIGVLTALSSSGSDWKYVASTWGNSDAKFKCTALGNNKWSYTINGNLRTFFGITNANEKIVKIAIRNIIISSFASGFFLGCCFPNKISLNILNKTYNSLPIPIITGTMCSTAIALSPLLLINYFCNGVLIDKFMDKFMDKYEINVERYHQYDDKNNKYAYPSFLHITVINKKTY
jgi:hypothetical protein